LEGIEALEVNVNFFSSSKLCSYRWIFI